MAKDNINNTNNLYESKVLNKIAKISGILSICALVGLFLLPASFSGLYALLIIGSLFTSSIAFLGDCYIKSENGLVQKSEVNNDRNNDIDIARQHEPDYATRVLDDRQDNPAPSSQYFRL